MDIQNSVQRWHRWVVSGPAGTLSELFTALDTGLPAGWRRLGGDDPLTHGQHIREGSGWYACDAPTHTVTLSLQPRGSSELRGGRVWFASPPHETQWDLSAAWGEVMRFLDRGLIPAARKAGAEVREPSLADVFFGELPTDVGDSLRLFSDSSRKVLPLTREESESWHAFIVTAFRSSAVFDAFLLGEWLVSEGWPRDAAVEIIRQFFDQCRLLAKFADRASVA